MIDQCVGHVEKVFTRGRNVRAVVCDETLKADFLRRLMLKRRVWIDVHQGFLQCAQHCFGAGLRCQ
ncbi:MULTISPECIES: hypothetical protein [Pseudomonas]|uniref:hypothetical protein n=1 Tax=unclassified Pseudomonas TaxID=196821 RepID=UPI00104DC810|nr:hypothetical protein [Pseudomonas sp. GV105]